MTEKCQSRTHNNTFPIKAGIGVDFTKDAKVLLIRDAITTVLH